MIFGILVLYLRCRRSSLHRQRVGFQRYEILPQDEDDSPFITQANGHNKTVRNTHAMPSDSEHDEGDEVLFTQNINEQLLA